MQLLDGKKLAAKISADLKKQVSRMEKKPVLAIVSVGDDPSSKIYVRNKKKACAVVGIEAREVDLPKATRESKLISLLETLNADDEIDAVILQLPLPKHIDRYNVLEAIGPEKDADCLSPLNFGSFFQKGESNFPIGPATPVGIIRLLEEYEIDIERKNAVLIGYSDIVGKPLSEMFLIRGATVTICHDKTHDLSEFTRHADILVSATGVKHLVRADMVKDGATVVDVGIHREGKKIFGDVEFAGVSRKASFVTPVPGGVGPMTVAILLENVVRLAELRSKKNEKLETENNGTSKIIKAEYDRWVALATDHASMIGELKARIDSSEKKQFLEGNNYADALRLMQKAVQEILEDKPSGGFSKKENYAARTENRLKKLSEKIQKSRRRFNGFKLASGNSKPKLDAEISELKIPRAYDEYYKKTRDFFNRLKVENDREIQNLESQDREIENKIANSAREFAGLLDWINEWQAWLHDRIEDLYWETGEDFHLAVVNYFETEKEKLDEF